MKTVEKQKTVEFKEDRFIELVLYVAARCGLDKHYGVLKLNKILFYSDFQAFKTRGTPITGAEYRKYTHGPAPALMKRIKLRLVAKGEAYEYENPLPYMDSDDVPMNEKRLLAIRKPEIDKLLSPEEIAIVDGVIERLRHRTGSEVSRMSHRHPGWRLANMEDKIPYVAALLPEEPPGPLSAKDTKRAKLVADRFGAAQRQVG